jgi:hypothetical protein
MAPISREEAAEFCRIVYQLVRNSSLEGDMISKSIDGDIARLEELGVIIRLK